MEGEGVAGGIASGKTEVLQFGEEGAGAGRGAFAFEGGERNWIWSEPGENAEEFLGGTTQLIYARLVGDSKATGVVHGPCVIPMKRSGGVVVPEVKVSGEREALVADVGCNLLQGESETTEFTGKFQNADVVVRSRGPMVGGAFEEKCGSILIGKDVEGHSVNSTSIVGKSTGDEDVTASQARKEFLH